MKPLYDGAAKATTEQYVKSPGLLVAAQQLGLDWAKPAARYEAQVD